MNKLLLAIMAAFLVYPSLPTYAQTTEILTIAQSLQAESLDHSDSYAKYEKALDLIQTFSGLGNNIEEAFSVFEEIRQADAKSPYPDLGMATLEFRALRELGQGSPESVRLLIDRALALDPNVVDAYVISTKLYLFEHRVLEASMAANKAISLNPADHEAMFAKAQASEAQLNFDEAEKWYRQAIAAHTNKGRQANVYYWLGKMLIKKSPPALDQAVAAVKMSADLSPDAPWKIINCAIFLNWYTTQYEEAINYSKKALALMEFPMARSTLGIAMYGKWAENYLAHPALDRADITPQDIVELTGVSPQMVFDYATKRMKSSRIQEALIKAGLVARQQ